MPKKWEPKLTIERKADATKNLEIGDHLSTRGLSVIKKYTNKKVETHFLTSDGNF